MICKESLDAANALLGIEFGLFTCFDHPISEKVSQNPEKASIAPQRQ